jgi:putative acetyltransferase
MIPVVVRRERSGDFPAIRHVNKRACNRPAEANLAGTLRNRHKVVVSLVAILDGQVVGHILFSLARIESREDVFPAVALAHGLIA